jgi:hypothetical protein
VSYAQAKGGPWIQLYRNKWQMRQLRIFTTCGYDHGIPELIVSATYLAMPSAPPLVCKHSRVRVSVRLRRCCALTLCVFHVVA